MRMNEELNKHLTEFTNGVIVEINSRNITDLTPHYLDDIFEYVLQKMRQEHTKCDGVNNLNFTMR